MRVKYLFYLSLSALIVRVLYFFQQLGSPFFARPLLDQHYYDLCARQLAGHGGDFIDGFRPLLYPLFLSLFYRIAPDSGLLLSLFSQWAMGIGITVLVATLTMQLFRNTAAGITAGLLYCLSAPPLYFEAQLLITTLFSFLLLLLSFVIFHAVENYRTSREKQLWLVAGILLALAAQARPNALPLLLFFPALTLLRLLKDKIAPSSFAPLLALPGLLCVQLIFGAINATYHGEFSLITQAGGINFYLGNAQKSDGMIPRQDRHVIYSGEYRDSIQVMAEQGYRETTGKSGEITQQEISNHWKQKAITEIQANPTRWLHLMAKKSWLLLWNHEVPNNRSFSFASTHDTPLLRALPVRWWLLLTLFPWGIAALKQRKAREQILWIFSFIFIFSGTIVLFFVNSRFRIPLWPLMAVIAGGGAGFLWTSIRTRMLPKIPVAVSLLLLPLSLINCFGIPPDPIENDLSMRASAYYDRGQYQAALKDIFQCLDRAPQNPRYHFMLGNILLASEEFTAAEMAYRHAIILNDQDPMFFNNLGIARESTGNLSAAKHAYTRASTLQPSHQGARINLLLLSIRTGSIDAAKEQLTLLLNEYPNHPTLLCAKAIIRYKETGDPSALEHARQLNVPLAEQLK
ncbi:MAG: tetratricopeptide repeat protein [Pontiella sp.]